ncbi:16S rRNA (uracil(1498)-N(3))-methyltransferase [Flaviflexus equikiangi]|uniref:Ribosomal RNA small subunit methyltransferase E n=1 Tax=Flaviflexus equikiangi TaxID=2758573 RepID=A0ABS2TDP4_9ACTO|nr:16S rRNA (uracil(1498)-N(3))-methyltransferase [Flaviflexus equikiangi]MBM9432762.1 16S rRNA (uracil(1498)-N(3))-methyltransferase [Flaviflexus equikiangi]
MTLPVYYCADLPDGGEVELLGEEARHAHVKRTTVGERIDLVDGDGGRVTVEVTGVSPSSLRGTIIGRRVDPRPEHPITLVQALAKGGRDEAAIESAVEVGVAGIVPWQADRSIVRWSGPKGEKGAAKWRHVALSAMKQSRQAFLPGVSDVVTSRQLNDRARSVTQAGGRVFICHETATSTLSSVTVGVPGPLWIIVGPEGGISEEELAGLVAAGGEPVLLGNSVLRSGTAGTVAATILQVISGTWR